MVGRKPKTTALKLVDGNPGKREIPAELDVAVEIPPCPPHILSAGDRRAEVAKAEWDRITPLLERVKLINPLYMAIVATYCDVWGEYIFAEEMLARPAEQGGGYLVKTPNNYEVQSPWVAIKNKAFEKLMKCESEMGFTPVSMARVVGGSSLPLFPDEDPMESLLQAKHGRPAAKA